MMKTLLLSAALVILVSGTASAQAKTTNCADMATTIEISNCFQSQYDEGEKERIALEEQALLQAAEYEELSKEMGSVQYEGLVELSKKSRSAFEEYREHECNRKQQSYGAGTMGAIAMPACLVALTEHRIKQLSAE